MNQSFDLGITCESIDIHAGSSSVIDLDLTGLTLDSALLVTQELDVDDAIEAVLKNNDTDDIVGELDESEVINSFNADDLANLISSKHNDPEDVLDCLKELLDPEG